LKIKVSLKDMPFGEHAVHIHQKPLCDAPDFKSAGGHFNPDNKQHGTMNPMGHHNGDLPQNISIGEDHAGTVSFSVTDLSLDPTAPDSILANGGTSIMVHEKADDMKTDPTGNAGNRIACGVITAP
jgi:Cu-Zn family superoxide dismutase